MKYLLDLILVVAVGVLWYCWSGARTQSAQLSDEASRLESTVGILKQEVEALTQKANGLEGNLAGTTEELKTTSAQLAEKVEQSDTLEKEKQMLQEGLRRARARIDELEGYKSRAQGVIRAEMPSAAP